MQYVSSAPATRLDVINAQEHLDQQLQQRQVCWGCMPVSIGAAASSVRCNTAVFTSLHAYAKPCGMGQAHGEIRSHAVATPESALPCTLRWSACAGTRDRHLPRARGAVWPVL